MPSFERRLGLPVDGYIEDRLWNIAEFIAVHHRSQADTAS